MKGNYVGFRNLMITAFLSELIYLEPLNIFLYTWRFLFQLQLEESNKFLKGFYRWFALFTILLIPLGFYCLVPLYVFEVAKYENYFWQLKLEEASKQEAITFTLSETLDIIGVMSSLIASLILVLVLRVLQKMI